MTRKNRNIKYAHRFMERDKDVIQALRCHTIDCYLRW